MDEQKRDLVRHTAYEQTRTDLKGFQGSKTSKRVSCNPPNIKCGGRCIPPTWDCRLKGQGTNAELKVHAQDISAGIASVQRGGVDVAKGVVSLNPARVERGRRSLIRGAVKIAPGDNLEKKKQLRKKLEQNTNVIAGAVAIGLAASGGYMVGRKLVPDKWKRKWEGPAINAFNQVLDVAPIIGGNRARQRQAAQMAATSLGGAITKGVKMQAVGQRAAGNDGGIGPLAFRARSANTAGAGVDARLSEIAAQKRSFEDWKQESTQALFGAKVNGHSIFSERATNEYLVSQYNLQSSRKVGAVAPGTNLSGATQSERNINVKNALAAKLQTMGEDMKTDAKLRGFPDTDAGRNRYVKEVALPGVERGLGKMSALQKQNALREASDLINSSWTKEGATRRAALIHKSTVEGYDTYFEKVAANVRRFSGNPVNRESPLGDANTALARYTIGRQAGTSPQIRSRNHADLLLREHYHTNVMGQNSGYIVSESRAKSIAQQITRSTTTPTTAQAFKTLNDNGFPYARSGKNATPTASKAPKTGLKAQQNLAALAKKIMAREGNSGMSYAAALRAARAEQTRGDDEHMSPTITKRNPPEPLVTNSAPTVVNGPTSTEHLPKDEDEMVTPLMPVSKMSESPSPKEAEELAQEKPAKPEGTVKISLNLEIPSSAIKTDAIPPRVAAYLQTREDLRGKSCGGSYIPKAHNCTKGQGKGATPESGTKSGGISGKQIAAAVLVGSVGAVAVAAANDAYQLNNGLGMPDTVSVRTAIKPHLNGGRGSDPAVMQAALGRYYDQQVKEHGWKVGDLIYSKTKNEPVSHFAIYMGKNKEGIHGFAMMGVDGLNGKQGALDVLEAGTGAKKKSGLLYAKAPSNKQPKVKYSPEEIASRVSRLQGKKLDYDTFNANCESWANMIVSGKSRSLQSQRLTLVGKTAIRGVYKSLESISALDEDYPKQVRSGDRIQKVARWLDNTNPRGNDLGYQAMVQRNSKYRKDAANSETLGLIDPSTVIKEHMSDIEAVSATKRWLMVLTAVSADGPN